MPMIDVYAAAGTFADRHKLAADLAGALMRIEQVPDIPMFRKNTAAFDRDKQLAVVRQFTDLIAGAAGDPALTDRTWVLLTEAPDGGWGLAGHANTNAELVAAARAQIAQLSAARSETTTD
jgi:phenylpyruvate tautomerase PptA (4-oxalocrotonate tautomerase family)